MIFTSTADCRFDAIKVRRKAVRARFARNSAGARSLLPLLRASTHLDPVGSAVGGILRPPVDVVGSAKLIDGTELNRLALELGIAQIFPMSAIDSDGYFTGARALAAGRQSVEVERCVVRIEGVDGEVAARLAVGDDRLIANHEDVIGRPGAVAESSDRHGLAVIRIEHFAFQRPGASDPTVEDAGGGLGVSRQHG